MSRIGETDIFRNKCKSKRSKITIESEDMLDVSLIGKSTGRMIHKGDNLVIVVFELFSRGLEGSSPNWNYVDALRVPSGAQGPNSVAVPEFVERKRREFRENRL